MAFTQSDLDALDAAIKSGVKTVTYADRTVTYHSLAEMMQARTIIQGEIAAAAGSAGGRSTLASFSRS